MTYSEEWQERWQTGRVVGWIWARRLAGTCPLLSLTTQWLQSNRWWQSVQRFRHISVPLLFVVQCLLGVVSYRGPVLSMFFFPKMLLPTSKWLYKLFWLSSEHFWGLSGRRMSLSYHILTACSAPPPHQTRRDPVPAWKLLSASSISHSCRPEHCDQIEEGAGWSLSAVLA